MIYIDFGRDSFLSFGPGQEPKKLQQRHRWKREGHPWHHAKRCERCGCLKDERKLFHVIYELNGEQFHGKAPACIMKNDV